MNLELLKSPKDWTKYFARQQTKVGEFNLINKNLPKEYPCFVCSQIRFCGYEYDLYSVFIYKEDAKKLLKAK